MSDFPRTVDAITTAWLSQTLAADVTAVSNAHIGEGVGLLGDIYRLTLTYAPDTEGPPTVIVKFPTTAPEYRGVADALGYFVREVNFYNDAASDAPFNTGKCHFAAMADDSTDFLLLLEDLAYLTAPDQLIGLTAEQAIAATVAIARHHAQWWQHPDLAKLEVPYLPVAADIYQAVLPDMFRASWAACKEAAADAVSHPEVLAFGDRYADAIAWMMPRLDQPRTWVHGDLRADNMMFAADGSPTLLDFQIMGQSIGTYDIAYLMSQSVPVEVRRDNEDRIVRAYHQQLLDSGVADYSWDQCWEDYRLCLAFCLIYPVTGYDKLTELNDRGRQLIDTMLERSVAAIIDTRAYELLPDTPTPQES